MSQATRYFVRVTPRGRQPVSFGWEICQETDALTLQCSTKAFPTRVEALLDSVRVAASLALVLNGDTTKNYPN
jgi:hypothetical protein